MIQINAPARLHLGVIDLSNSLNRLYGSIGVAINQPCVEILAEESKEIEVCYEANLERFSSAENIIKRLLKRYNIKGGVRISIIKSIPSHVGLGSTTQLSLSIALAISKLYGIKANALEMAKLLGRGRVSGVGTALFERGGFIVDGGIGRKQAIPPVIFHHSFPESWYFVVATPSAKRGLSEKAEAEVFKKASASPKYAEKICHLLVMKLLPSLIEEDLDEFGAALTEIQRNVGAAFAPYQKGLFHSRATEEIIELMLQNGAKGAGQSSWGPSAYGIVEGEKAALKLRAKVESYLKNKDKNKGKGKGKGKSKGKGIVFHTNANNVGATVKIMLK
jgi:beta-ribofuranosylaminobenzene 5'-phosphate synthase